MQIRPECLNPDNLDHFNIYPSDLNKLDRLGRFQTEHGEYCLQTPPPPSPFIVYMFAQSSWHRDVLPHRPCTLHEAEPGSIWVHRSPRRIQKVEFCRITELNGRVTYIVCVPVSRAFWCNLKVPPSHLQEGTDLEIKFQQFGVTRRVQKSNIMYDDFSNF